MGLSYNTLTDFCGCKYSDKPHEERLFFCCNETNKDNTNENLSYLAYSNNNNIKKSATVYSYDKSYNESIIIQNNAANKIINFYRKFKNQKPPPSLRKSRTCEEVIGRKTSTSNFKQKKNSIFYLGEKNSLGQKNGFGIDMLNNEIKYIGYYKNDKASGIGKYIDGSDIYEGEFENDGAYGFGIYKNSDKLIYIGEWINDSQENYGIEKWKDGSKYFGEYKGGKKNGLGTYVWGDGFIYEGEWVDNHLEGYGIYYGNNQNIYIGQWKKSLKEGFGELLWSDKKYLGFFSDDKKNGFGIYYCKNINKAFSGFWKKGKRFGFGKYMDRKTKKYGLWDENGKVNWLKNEDEAFNFLESKNLNNYKIYFELTLDDISNYCINNDDIDYLVKWTKITNNFY